MRKERNVTWVLYAKAASCTRGRDVEAEAAWLRAARQALGAYALSTFDDGPIGDVDSQRAEYRPALESPTQGTIRALLLSESVLM